MSNIDVFQNDRRKDYAIYLISLCSYRSYYTSIYDRLQTEYRISEDEFESLFDWLITHALDNYLRRFQGTRVIYHYRHDVYKCVYDEYGHPLVNFISTQLSIHNLNFLRDEEVKVLVAGETLIITRGVKKNAGL